MSALKGTSLGAWSSFLRPAILLAVLLPNTLAACTIVRFDSGGNLIVARNHDWPFGEGLLVVNQRGIEKNGISPVNPARWVSRFGSVSFTQFGREIPFAGMNERGLTVDLLQLSEAQFSPAGPKVTTVNVVQWVQYQLDTAETVADVITSLQHVLPAPVLEAVERVHYFVTDANGDVAVIEFLDGQPVVQHGTDRQQCALANSTWKDSSQALNATLIQQRYERRYIQAVQSIGNLAHDSDLPTSIDFAFETLDEVSQPNLTQWQIVYLPRERQIHFQTARTPTLRCIDLDDLSFDAEAPVLVLDVDADQAGDLLNHFVVYDAKANQRIVDNAFDRLVPPGIARIAVKQLILNYPSTLKVAQSEATVTRTDH